MKVSQIKVCIISSCISFCDVLTSFHKAHEIYTWSTTKINVFDKGNFQTFNPNPYPAQNMKTMCFRKEKKIFRWLTNCKL